MRMPILVLDAGIWGVLMRVTIEDSGGRVTIDGGVVAKDAQEAWDGVSIAARLVKSAPERRYTLHCAYPCDRVDRHVAADGYRDFASAEAVEDAAWSFLIKSPKIGLGHRAHTEGSGTVCESYLYRGPDWTLQAANGEECTIKAGDWMVGIIWNPDVWPKILKGEIGGVSMQGSASRRKPSRESLARLRDLSRLQARSSDSVL
jgi:Putative phage serine protease XkdF